MCGDSVLQDCRIPGFTFPYDQRIPTRRDKIIQRPLVTGLVRPEFFLPELLIGLWLVGQPATRMPVPVASVDEDYLASPGKDQVWATGKVAPVKPEPVAERMGGAAHQHLGLGVRPPDLRHHGGPARLVDDVHHR